MSARRRAAGSELRRHAGELRACCEVLQQVGGEVAGRLATTDIDPEGSAAIMLDQCARLVGALRQDLDAMRGSK